MQTNSFQGSSASRMVFLTVIISLCGLLLFSTTAAAALESTERIVWRKSPIALELGVGQERMVHFPGPVSVGVPAALQGRLRIQSSGGTVYWLAQQAFSPSRILVRSISWMSLPPRKAAVPRRWTSPCHGNHPPRLMTRHPPAQRPTAMSA